MLVGIDPGVSGAIAVLNNDGTLAAVHDMPIVNMGVGGKTRNRIAVPLLCDMLHGIRGRATDGLHAILENVGPRPRDTGVTAFGLGYSKGAIEGVLAALGVSLTLIAPAAWKKAMGLDTDKGKSRMLAMRTWPGMATLFQRVKDDGRAEAALLARHFHLKTKGLAA